MSDASADGHTTRDPGELSGVLTLARALLIKEFLIMLRYRINFLAAVIGMYLFFAIIFFGGQATAGTAITNTLDGLIVGWFLFTMAQSAYFGLSQDVTNESQWGTFEQLYMSPYGFGTVMSMKVVVNLLQSVLLGVIMLALMMVTTGRALTLDVPTIAPIVLLGLVSITGIGFVFAGVTLIYKKIENVSQLMQFVIIGFIAAPVASGFDPLRFLPLVQASAMLQEAMRRGVRLWEFPLFDLGVLVGTAVVYVLAGYLVFRVCSNVARTRGVMGHY